MSINCRWPFVADPITVTQTDINPVGTMGTAFAPYFSTLALWIGALLICLGLGRRAKPRDFPEAPGVSVALGRYVCLLVQP
jgi:putative membrane protein